MIESTHHRSLHDLAACGASDGSRKTNTRRRDSSTRATPTARCTAHLPRTSFDPAAYAPLSAAVGNLLAETAVWALYMESRNPIHPATLRMLNESSVKLYQVNGVLLESRKWRGICLVTTKAEAR